MDGHHSKQFLECVLEALTVARLEIMNSCHNYVCLFLTVDLEVDDGGEGVVDAVLRLAEVPPLVALLHLQRKRRKQMKPRNRFVDNYGWGREAGR